MSNEVLKLIQNHRSIRKFASKPISEDVLCDILNCAQWAPSSHNVQAYSIIVIKDKSKKEQLSKICRSQKWVIDCPVFLVFCADYYRLKLTTEMYEKNFEIDEVENLLVGAIDTALAADNLFIAAKSFGLGGVFMGGIRNDLELVSQLLEIPKYVIPLFGMCLGYPADIPWQKPRLPKRNVIHNESYNASQMLSGLKEYEGISSDYYIRRTNGERTAGWTKQMAEYLSKPRHPEVKSFIKKQGLQLE